MSPITFWPTSGMLLLAWACTTTIRVSAFSIPSPSEFTTMTNAIAGPQQQILVAEVDAAAVSRIQFAVLLIFGSGPFVSGFSSLPIIQKGFDEMDSCKGGKTLGGPELSMNPLQGAFLPEPLRAADVEKCLEVCPPASRLPTDTSLPIPDATCAGDPENLRNFVAREAFTSTLIKKGCNPLAVACLFKALSPGGSSTKFASVEDIDAKLAVYRNDIERFKADLGKANSSRIAALVTFATLLAGVAVLTLASALQGFVLNA